MNINILEGEETTHFSIVISGGTVSNTYTPILLWIWHNSAGTGILMNNSG